MASIGEALLIALDLLESGRLEESEALCRRILNADSGRADVWHLSGLVSARRGRLVEARERLAMAVRHAPERVDLHLNHAASLKALNHPLAEALRRVLALVPARAEHWLALAEAAEQERGSGAAIGPWRALTRLQPGSAGLHYNLGVALQMVGRGAEAALAYAAATGIEPTLADAHFNRANALRDLGSVEAAARAYRAALVADPARGPVARNLGLMLMDSDAAAAAAASRVADLLEPERADAGFDRSAALIAAERPQEALSVLNVALALRPELGNGHNNRALALRALGRMADARAALALALAADPALPEAWTNLAQGRRDDGRPGEAETAIRRALRLQPAYPAALGVLAAARLAAGHPEDAVSALRRAMAIDPCLARGLHSNYLLARQSDPDAEPETLLNEHQRWARLHGPPRSGDPRPPALPTDAAGHRRLRIAYLSADFWQHSVASFFEPLLGAHDRSKIHVVCYSAVRRPDSTTARLRELADDWRDVTLLNDGELAALIRDDRIDALIDLGGHTEDSRLGVLALPSVAPVRLTVLGYPGTTGLSITGRLTDPLIEPPDAERWSSEPLVPLSQGFLCYRAPDGAPEPRARREAGPVMFGSFNALGKLTSAVVTAWAGILSDLPDARLMLKSRALGDPAVAADVGARFASHGIAEDRLDLVAWTVSRTEHLALYDRIDVGLDPFPYNGTTTTCEAMWMGVPVVTLTGNRHAARVGTALLTRVGLPDLIAGDVGSYRKIAVQLAADRGRLADLRTGLRARMLRGPLGDAAGLARNVEAACRRLLLENSLCPPAATP